MHMKTIYRGIQYGISGNMLVVFAHVFRAYYQSQPLYNIV